MSVDEVTAKVQRILTEEFGTVRIDRDGDFGVQNESAVAFVSVKPWGDDEVVVHVTAYMLNDVPLTPEVFEWVATEGSYFFGHVHVLRTEGESTGTLVFTHTLLGDFLDKPELLHAVNSVAILANNLDDELQSRFGGRKFIEE
jgi:hypothetical protein